MKALLYSDWGTLQVARVPTFQPAADEVVVRVATCGICGSELETFATRSPRRQPPLVMGHEFCGVIEEVGSQVSAWEVGQSVVCHAVVHCGECSWCGRARTNLCPQRQVFGMHRPGAFAEFVTVPARVLVPWPDGLSPVVACLAEPLANGLNALSGYLDDAMKGVLIIGAGPIGLMCLLAAKHVHGASVAVSDVLPQRLGVARHLGADLVLDPASASLPEAIRDLWGTDGADYVVDAVGSAGTKAQSLELVAPGGTAVWLGLHRDCFSFHSYDVTLFEKNIRGSYSGTMQDLTRAVGLLTEGVLDPAGWAETVPLDHGAEAFSHMLSGNASHTKSILTMR